MTTLQETSPQTERPAVTRLPYEKPAMRSISLVADQVLGIGCKTVQNQVAPLNPVGCLASVCSSAGT